MARLKSTLAQKLAHQKALDRVVSYIEVDRRRRPPPQPRPATVGPTEQRQARAGNGLSSAPGGPTRIVSAIDLYRRELSAEEIMAHEICELCFKANAACAAPVASYSGVKGSSYGPRGGRVHEADRDDFNAYQDVWSQIEAPYQQTLLDLVYSSDVSVTAHGAKWMSLQDKATQRGGGIVALRAALIRAHSVLNARRRRRHNGGPAIDASQSAM